MVPRRTQANIANLAQGYSSCIFAYGQTGSGKTHTMTHLNERLLAELFRLKVRARAAVTDNRLLHGLCGCL